MLLEKILIDYTLFWDVFTVCPTSTGNNNKWTKFFLTSLHEHLIPRPRAAGKWGFAKKHTEKEQKKKIENQKSAEKQKIRKGTKIYIEEWTEKRQKTKSGEKKQRQF